jgi:hypothetical protein
MWNNTENLALRRDYEDLFAQAKFCQHLADMWRHMTHMHERSGTFPKPTRMLKMHANNNTK